MYEYNERLLTDCLLKKFNNIESYSFTNARLCYDGWFKINGKTYLLEVKVRGNTINQYPDYFLETAKLNNLMESAKIQNLGVVYINYFKTEDPQKWDYIIFNLRARANAWNENNKPTVEFIPMNEKTFESRDKKVQKLVIRLNFNDRIDTKGTINLN